MKINSFVVILSKYGQVLHFEGPRNLSSAVKKYNEYIAQYRKEGVLPNHTHSAGDYNDGWIEEQIRKWKGNSVAINWLLTSVFSSQFGNITVTLKHSSLP